MGKNSPLVTATLMGAFMGALVFAVFSALEYHRCIGHLKVLLEKEAEDDWTLGPDDLDFDASEDDSSDDEAGANLRPYAND